MPAAEETGREIVRRSVGPPGERISYLVTGERRAETAPTILLIHGAGVSARSWTLQLQALGEAAHVLAIDLPGHGESDPIPKATVEGYADAARGLLEALGIGRVFVVGHSLGGAVAQALAARDVEAVRGLVLISTCAKLPEIEGSRGRFLWYLPGPVRKLVFFAMAKKILFAPGAPRQSVLLGMEELRSCRPETILEDVAAARTIDLEDIARGLRVPTLIMCGSGDRLTPPRLSERLHELIDGARLRIVEGAGHMLPLEAPDKVNDEILALAGSVKGIGVRRLLGDWSKRSILRRLIEAGKALLR